MDSNNSIFNLKKLIEGIYLREHEELTLDHLMIALLEIPELDHLFSSTGLQMTKIKNDLKDETDKSYKNSELRRRLEIHRSQDSYELEKLLATLEKVESPSALFVFLKVLSQSANAKNFFYDSVLKSTPEVLAKLNGLQEIIELEINKDQKSNTKDFRFLNFSWGDDSNEFSQVLEEEHLYRVDHVIKPNGMKAGQATAYIEDKTAELEFELLQRMDGYKVSIVESSIHLSPSVMNLLELRIKEILDRGEDLPF